MGNGAYKCICIHVHVHAVYRAKFVRAVNVAILFKISENRSHKNQFNVEKWLLEI